MYIKPDCVTFYYFCINCSTLIKETNLRDFRYFLGKNKSKWKDTKIKSVFFPGATEGKVSQLERLVFSENFVKEESDSEDSKSKRKM